MTQRLDRFGSEHYRSARSRYWNALLVEPTPVRELREAAADRLTRLGNVAPPKSGIPPRAVRYFCLEELDDEEAQRANGIETAADRRRLALVRDGQGALHVLERRALQPLVRRPRDVEGWLRVPKSAFQGHYLFYVHDDLAELRRRRQRNTIAYIEHGQRTDYLAPDGSRRAGGVPAERPQVSVRNQWWSVPTMPLGQGRVILPKGRGLHCVPELPADVAVLDNYYYAAPVDGLANHHALPAVLNLSFSHLMAEVQGRRNAGDGVLHTYIRELQAIPVINPASLTENEANDVVEAFEPLTRRPQLPIDQELRQSDRQTFDRVAMQVLFGEQGIAAADVVERALRDLAAERVAKAVSGTQQVKRAARRQQFDPRATAARIAHDLDPPPNPLAALTGQASDAGVVVEVPDHPPARSVEIRSTLFAEGAVHINGGAEPLVDAPSAQHAELLVAAITADAELSGPVAFPADAEEAERHAREWRAAWQEWLGQANGVLEDLMPGGQRAGRRRRVLVALLELYRAAPEEGLAGGTH